MKYVAAGMVVALLVGEATAQATARRDPTQPPPGYGVPAAAATRDPIEAFRPGHLMIVDGQRYLMWQGRRYRVGDTIQGARIERIEESEIWLRNEGGLRKLALFPHIDKRPTTSAPAASTAQATTGKGQVQ